MYSDVDLLDLRIVMTNVETIWISFSEKHAMLHTSPNLSVHVNIR